MKTLIVAIRRCNGELAGFVTGNGFHRTFNPALAKNWDWDAGEHAKKLTNIDKEFTYHVIAWGPL